MSKDKKPTKLDPVKEAEAKSFLSRLITLARPANHYIMEGVEVTAPVRKRKKRVKQKDPVATVTADPDSKAVKQDVVAAMTKIRGTLATIKTMRDNDLKARGYDSERAEDDEEEATRKIVEGLHEKGRDKIAYATFARKGKMDELLDAWDDSWPVEKTAGLLVDMSLALRRPRARDGDVPTAPRGELLSQHLQNSRAEKDHAVNKESDWYQDLPENTETHAGASATTANLLLMLEDLDVPLAQVEAIMNGLVKYWSGPARKASGHYHTPAEIWAVYNDHLERRLSHQWAINKQRLEDEAQERADEADRALQAHRDMVRQSTVDAAAAQVQVAAQAHAAALAQTQVQAPLGQPAVAAAQPGQTAWRAAQANDVPVRQAGIGNRP